MSNPLQFTLGEVHLGSKLGPGKDPHWLTIPVEGLNLGLFVLGASGAGKSAGVILPAAHQLFGWQAENRETRCGGLVLEVKGDFCKQIESILIEHGRGEDYIELSLDSKYVYNPLHNDASPTTIAFNLISLMNTLREGGKGDKFWDAAAESLIAFIVLVYRLLYDYVTLFDIYEASSSLDVIARKMNELLTALQHSFILIDKRAYLDAPQAARITLDTFEWENAGEQLKTSSTVEAATFLTAHSIEYETHEAALLPDHAERLAKLATAQRYFAKLQSLDAKLRTSVAEGINVFLLVADFDPNVRRILCPPREAYDPVLNADGRYGVPLPPLAEMVEGPWVLALNMPVSADESLARTMGTLLKQDWQRAILNRIPKIEDNPDARYQVMLIDEYHLMATAGGKKPTGDDKFCNLSRAARCIPICAVQHLTSLKDTVGEMWDTLSSGFATWIVLRQKSYWSADIVSKMCGRGTVLEDHSGMTEGLHDAKISWWTGKLFADKASVNMSQSFNAKRDNVIEAKTIMELPRGVAVVLANDGKTQMDPSFVYLKPYGTDPNVGYFAA